MDSLPNKRTELYHVVAHDDPDIICLSEILPKNCRVPVELCELDLKDYDCFTNIKEDNVHRGVATYVKKSLNAVPSLVIADFAESTWCEIPLTGPDRVLIGCVYRSPNSSLDNDVRLNNALKEITKERSHVLITGDFNHPDIDWKNELSPLNPMHASTISMDAVRENNFLNVALINMVP